MTRDSTPGRYGDEIKRVLITGAAGTIGQVLMKRLADAYELRGLDTRPAENVATASIGEYQTLLSHMEGVDVVIHLAAALKSDSWPDLLRDNIVGTRNVYEASKAQGVRRVVFASSHQTTRLYEDDEPYVSVLAGRRPPDGMRPITVDLPFRPSGLFGTSKAFGEILGRAYADHYGLSVLCIRIVQVNRENRPHGPRWFSHDDVEQMVRRCIEAKDIKFGVYYGVSGNSHAVWDISNAERDLGYRPRDRHE